MDVFIYKQFIETKFDVIDQVSGVLHHLNERRPQVAIRKSLTAV
jgi:hypothetical protein